MGSGERTGRVIGDESEGGRGLVGSKQAAHHPSQQVDKIPMFHVPASDQDHCLTTMKQEALDPAPLLSLSNLESSCPPLSSLTASIEAKDCDVNTDAKDDEREDSRHTGGGKV